MRNGIPSHDTFNRVFCRLQDPGEVSRGFSGLDAERALQAVGQEIVALDGKALRRAIDGDDSLKYWVGAWAEGNGLVLGQMKVAGKSNETTAVPRLLRVLELSGCIVTLDAMGCQKKIAKEIIEADADAVLALKGNQETGSTRKLKNHLDAALAEQQGLLLCRGAKLFKAAATLAALESRWRKVMAGWKPAVTFRALNWLGLPTEPSGGKVCARWGWWRRFGKSRARGRWNGATICPACRWGWKRLRGRCAATGESTTSCIGPWTFVLGRTSSPHASPSCA